MGFAADGTAASSLGGVQRKVPCGTVSAMHTADDAAKMENSGDFTFQGGMIDLAGLVPE